MTRDSDLKGYAVNTFLCSGSPHSAVHGDGTQLDGCVTGVEVVSSTDCTDLFCLSQADLEMDPKHLWIYVNVSAGRPTESIDQRSTWIRDLDRTNEFGYRCLCHDMFRKWGLKNLPHWVSKRLTIYFQQIVSVPSLCLSVDSPGHLWSDYTTAAGWCGLCGCQQTCTERRGLGTRRQISKDPSPSKFHQSYPANAYQLRPQVSTKYINLLTIIDYWCVMHRNAFWYGMIRCADDWDKGWDWCCDMIMTMIMIMIKILIMMNTTIMIVIVMTWNDMMWYDTICFGYHTNWCVFDLCNGCYVDSLIAASRPVGGSLQSSGMGAKCYVKTFKIH